ncbi:mechanosensitive ion channel family protein [Solidesulfovibrio magneticus]|uniref:Mechanosensitive ion channel family protein n=1 Tax=Solidesulfovibrio magneticus (strain ATCC 700980 / DSM 13731 / RS-1) TaxID=573370 RepID=C4XLC2_SOLM1|nr:mechanosensitive ion channel domain-containing protein [Solidesulfovibrio magneticus]BAH77061.1 mechanosensitive ion channel family protein [Solidesulfovibrio magneticus RS-1]
MPLKSALIAVWLILALAAGSWAAAPAAGIGDSDQSWTLVLDALDKQGQIMRGRLEAFKARRDLEIAASRAELEHLLRDRARLALWQATASDPWEIRTVMAGLARLRRDVDHLSQRPQQAWTALEQNVALIESFRDKLDDITRREVPERFRDNLAPTRKQLADLGTEIATLRDSLADETTPLRELGEQLKEAESNLQSSLAPAWKAYYTDANPSLFSGSYLRFLGEDIEDWLLWSNLCLELLRTPAMLDMAAQGAGVGVVAALVVMGLALAVRRLGARHGLSARAQASFVRAGACAAGGVGFMVLAQYAPFFLFTLLISVSETLYAAALVHLSRLALRDRDLRRPAVLWPTWRLFALGLLLEAGRYPESVTGPAMAVVLLFAARGFLRRHRATPKDLPLERAITAILAYALPPLAVCSLLGLPQTAILCASGLFYVTLALRFAALTVRFLASLEVERAHGRPPLYIGILTGAGFPFFFMAFLFLFLWLLSNQYGGENVFLEVLNTETRIDSVGISLQKLVLLLLGFYVTRAVIALSAAFIADIAGRRRAVERGAKSTLLRVSTYFWWGLYAVFSLSVLGLSLTSIAVVAGGLSVGIGFGLQTTVNNFVSGLILLFGRSIQAGDTIQIGEGEGVVKEVNIRNTEVLTRENATVFVPNSELVSGRIVNWSHKDPSVRRDINIGVAYGSDTDKVRELLLAAAGQCPAVLENPAPAVLHWDFGPSTLDFKLRVWLADVNNAVSSLSMIRTAIDRLFREAGIEIAFPQTDLHLRTAPALEHLAAPHFAETARLLAAVSSRLDALEQRLAGRPARLGDEPDKGTMP